MKLTRSTLEYWALIAEIVGGLAVVISVIYLALQISDNTRVLRSQAHYNALSLAQRPREMVIENERLAKILSVCFSTPTKLSEEEWTRCSDYLLMQLNAWEYLYYQNRDGSIPKELWVGADASFKRLIATKDGYHRFWAEWDIAFDEPFRSYVTREFAKKPAPTQH